MVVVVTREEAEDVVDKLLNATSTHIGISIAHDRWPPKIRWRLNAGEELTVVSTNRSYRFMVPVAAEDL
ncbi:hypothetical protein DKX38_017771 [Salix brachista]|uniref:Uncharacterized protein n=1 Tax=Salix brachista TaxID=2182728 RepID=A0A5N5KW41_9ROSI|nr:hypothetical protein DKX38_017771 [Salix brachista]